ncbi:MAG: VWA domain-containing protein [Pirellulaceae bacterium]|nr:VWA domain-containing protein [Pirellulaceae bacterium]
MNTPIEPWKLTAYLLGELNENETRQIRSAIENDQELELQTNEMQQVIDRVQSVMQRSDSERIPNVASPQEWSDQILNGTALAAGSKPNYSETAASAGGSQCEETAASAGGSRGEETVARVGGRKRWMGLLTIAASLMLAAVLIPLALKYGSNPFEIAMSSKDESEGSELETIDLANMLANDAPYPTSGGITDPSNLQINEELLVLESGTSTESKGLATVPPANSVAGTVVQPAEVAGQSAPTPEDHSVINKEQLGTNRVDDYNLPEGKLGKNVADLEFEAKPSSSGEKREKIAGTGRIDLGAFGNLPYSESVPAIQGGTNLTYELQQSNEFREQAVVEGIALGLPHPSGMGDKQTSSMHGDQFESIQESNFIATEQAPLSTFSIDVDTASYSKVRQYLMQSNQLPRPDAVRIEEMINYFEYDYAGPSDGRPFASHMAIANCPWNEDHKLVRIGLQAKKMDVKERAKANLVFLLDVSGSMDQPNKLPLVKQAMRMLIQQLGENDRIAMVVYAGAAGCVLPSITGDQQSQILAALDRLNAGGSTNGAQGIELAYSIARDHFVPVGINRIILCTDGDFNVGVTSNDALVQLVQEQAKSKIFLTCLGFGIGNYNDSMMEQISNKGNGVYGMVDSPMEARRLMVEQLSGTLTTVAKDVKIQVEFNPAKISNYRLIGYENRRLANADFNNDKKDAGEIGAGHCVTALYEVVAAGMRVEKATVDELRYRQTKPSSLPSDSANKSVSGPALAAGSSKSGSSNEWLTLKLRYKQPDEDISSKLEFFLTDESALTSENDREFRWSTAVAEFGLLLRHSSLAPQADWGRMIERARSAAGNNPYRLECLDMMSRARSMSGQ